MSLVLLTLLLITILYFVIALLPIKLCAICTSVSVTWLGLLLGYFLSWHDNILLLGILMGGSVVGLAYKAEYYFKTKKLTNYWLVRIGIIVIGFLSAYLLVGEEWDILILVVIIAVLFGFFSLFFVKSENDKDVSKHGKFKDRLDHCCE